ncbi:DUF317 domain-containing protein [Streptomyces fragilis]|uniref:DUF317 domain-containing protein n=1 Tax=Streptomyces fragilis TaxID=67301 RepID=A0ABV2YC83_9ACTN|nr:DUF317 domain-containing protein [Streptomyces fragilis]
MNQNSPIDRPSPNGALPVYWVGPRCLAGDDGRLYDTVADTLTGLGWTALTIVRGLHEDTEFDDVLEDRQVLRSTVLHVSPDGLRWAQWMLADEPFHLGGLPMAWQVCAREDRSDMTARWSAYFTPGLPGEAVADFLLALDARDRPATSFGGPDRVLDAVTAKGWFRDIDQPAAGATDPTFTSHLAFGEVPPLIQDGDPSVLTVGPEEAGPMGWQAWSQPAPDAPYLWAASFSAGVPADLVAAFAASLSSTAPVLRRVLPESTKDRLLRAPA